MHVHHGVGQGAVILRGGLGVHPVLGTGAQSGAGDAGGHLAVLCGDGSELGERDRRRAVVQGKGPAAHPSDHAVHEGPHKEEGEHQGEHPSNGEVDPSRGFPPLEQFLGPVRHHIQQHHNQCKGYQDIPQYRGSVGEQPACKSQQHQNHSHLHHPVTAVSGDKFPQLGCRFGLPPPEQVGGEVGGKKDEEKAPANAGEEVPGAGQQIDRPVYQGPQPGTPHIEAQQQEDDVDGQRPPEGLSNLIQLNFWIRLNGDGVLLLVVVELVGTEDGGQLPAGVGAEVLKSELLLRGLRGILGVFGVVGDGKVEPFGGNPAVVPAPGRYPVQQPALGRPFFQVGGHAGAVIEGKRNEIALAVFHWGASSPNIRR